MIGVVIGLAFGGLASRSGAERDSFVHRSATWVRVVPVTASPDGAAGGGGEPGLLQPEVIMSLRPWR